MDFKEKSSQCSSKNSSCFDLEDIVLLNILHLVSLARHLLLRCREYYRTLHSYNLIWVVCHLFPRQRWRTLTYSVSGNHWPGEPRDLLKTTSARKFRPALGATSKTRIFHKYVVFKHSFSLFPYFFAAATHSLQCDSTDVK